VDRYPTYCDKRRRGAVGEDREGAMGGPWTPSSLQKSGRPGWTDVSHPTSFHKRATNGWTGRQPLPEFSGVLVVVVDALAQERRCAQVSFGLRQWAVPTTDNPTYATSTQLRRRLASLQTHSVHRRSALLLAARLPSLHHIT